MPGQEQNNFEALKKKIVEVMQRSYPGINPSIADWKGQEITDFQEDLRIKVNANISEKWFYTHMKSTNPTLPRIDMLNILSKYADYANWDDFVFKNGQKIIIPVQEVHEPVKVVKVNVNRYFVLVPLMALAVVAVFIGIFFLFNTHECHFTFVDNDTQEPITNIQTEIILLPEGESPVHYKVEKDGCFSLKTDDYRIKMVVKAPYYLPDTIDRIVRNLRSSETIMLKPDNYSMMIHYFSTSRVDSWEKRRTRLKEIIADSAMICQVMYGVNETGVALLNKEEFIDKMTVPSGSLKNMEILGSQVKNGRIVLLKFRIKGGIK